jgi:hypothetical protein
MPENIGRSNRTTRAAEPYLELFAHETKQDFLSASPAITKGGYHTTKKGFAAISERRVRYFLGKFVSLFADKLASKSNTPTKGVVGIFAPQKNNGPGFLGSAMRCH